MLLSTAKSSSFEMKRGKKGCFDNSSLTVYNNMNVFLLTVFCYFSTASDNCDKLLVCHV